MTININTPMSEEMFLSKILPVGWKVIRARYGKVMISLIISPEGKRFDTLQKAHDFIIEEKDKAQKVSRKEEIMKKLFDSENTPLALSESAKFKRKFMANKNPFRNLLKRTLEKNHVINVSQEQTSINYQKYLIKRKRNLKKVSKGL